jgi:hypothetical protein
MKTFTTLLLCSIFTGVGAPTAAFAASPDMPIKAQVEKTNAILTVVEGDVCKYKASNERKSALCAKTSDFKGKKMQVWAAFAESVKEATLAPLREKGGSSLEGTLQCKRIRMGTLPDIPQFNDVVLADGCTITALTNK